MKKKIAVLAGDGIGPEVMQETVKVLEVVAKKFAHDFDYVEGDIGGAAYERYAQHCPPETTKICQTADAILFGSVGGPITEQHLAKWKNCETNSILALRKQFNLTINIRPIVISSSLMNKSPLKETIIHPGVDCVIFRELTGGIYFGRHELSEQNEQRVALDECIYSEKQISQIAHHAFQSARLRKKKLCSVDKANVLMTSKLWRNVMNEVASNYPDVQLTHMLVDNCAMQLVLNPNQFDVIVTENMFGDILSDLAAALTGSLGLIPSASLNDVGFGLYESSGGSAPDIAGQGIANPCAQVLSAALMLRHSFSLHEEAFSIEKAVRETLAIGKVTHDLTKDKRDAVSTSEFIDLLIRRLQ